MQQPFVRPQQTFAGVQVQYLALHVVRQNGRAVIETVLPANEKPADFSTGMSLQEGLGLLGRLGWELVGIDSGYREDGGPSIYVFKRLT